MQQTTYELYDSECVSCGAKGKAVSGYYEEWFRMTGETFEDFCKEQEEKGVNIVHGYGCSECFDWDRFNLAILGDVLTPGEAEERWGLKEGTVRAALNRGRFDEQIREGAVRKSKKVWLLTDQAMREVYGAERRP